MGARNQVGIWLSYRPANQCSLATQFQTRFLELIPGPTQSGTQVSGTALLKDNLSANMHLLPYGREKKNTSKRSTSFEYLVWLVKGKKLLIYAAKSIGRDQLMSHIWNSFHWYINFIFSSILAIYVNNTIVCTNRSQFSWTTKNSQKTLYIDFYWKCCAKWGLKPNPPIWPAT